MSGSPTNVNLNDTVPTPKPDAFNVEWQAGAAYPDPNQPGSWVRDTTACYRTPPVGGVLVQTADYQLSETDSGLTLIANSGSAITFTLPAVIPFLATPQGVWNVRIENKGAGLLTVDPNGLNLDGSGATVDLATGAGFSLSTDGTDYWSSAPSFAMGVVVDSSSNATLAGTINGSNMVFTLSTTPRAFLGIFYNGTFKVDGFSVSGTTLTLTFAPDSGDRIDALYLV